MAPREAAAFDLLQNPFAVFGIEPTSDLQTIAAAYEDAVADEIASEADLNAKREALINPRLRIAAELAFLIDTPPREAKSILESLKGEKFAALLRTAEKLAPLSRANLLAHISARGKPDQDLLFAFIDAHALINPNAVYSKIESIRRTAEFVSPDADLVRQQLHELLSIHAKAAFSKFDEPDASLPVVRECVRRVLASADPDKIDALDGFLPEYRRLIDPELSALEIAVGDASTQLKQEPDALTQLQAIAASLQRWSELAWPLLEVDAYKQRDEERARQLFLEVRGLSLALANESERFDIALSLSKVAAQAFAPLPRAGEQLAEDIKVLEDRSAEAAVVPLKETIDQLRATGLRDLISQLRETGFRDSAKGDPQRLWQSFDAAATAVAGSTACDIPWLMIRSLAIEINNEENEPIVAKALLEGLRSARKSPSETVRQQLADDIKAVDRNILEKQLLKEIEARHFGTALGIIAKLIANSTSYEEKRPFLELKSQLESKRNTQYVKWGAAAAAVAFIIFAVIQDNASKSRRDYEPPPTRVALPSNDWSPPSRVPPSSNSALSLPPPTVQENATEQIPPVGTGRDLDRAQVRYCKYQEARMEAAQALIDRRNSDEVDAFNRLVNDWNSRCSNYRYRQTDLNAVTAETSTKAGALVEAGRDIVTGWRRERTAQSRRAAAPSTNAWPSNSLQNAPTATSPSIQPQDPLPPPTPPPALEAASYELDLLRLEVATTVQKRLNALGFFKGPINGVWGPHSRAALRSFKVANGLPANDQLDRPAYDALISSSAVARSPNAKEGVGGKPETESSFTPPSGATLHPLNAIDASKIHARLRKLGFYSAASNSLWSGSSRDALRAFKVGNSLPADDQWDAETEAKLMDVANPSSVRDVRATFEAAIGGLWAAEVRACPGGSEPNPISISSRAATSQGGSCDFNVLRQQGQNWRATAVCTASGETWKANITLVRSGDTLTWNSERGTAKYLRCNG